MQKKQVRPRSLVNIYYGTEVVNDCSEQLRNKLAGICLVHLRHHGHQWWNCVIITAG